MLAFQMVGHGSSAVLIGKPLLTDIAEDTSFVKITRRVLLQFEVFPAETGTWIRMWK